MRTLELLWNPAYFDWTEEEQLELYLSFLEGNQKPLRWSLGN